MLKNLIDAILKEAPHELKLISDAMLANDATSIQQSAHKLRGALGYFGVTPMKQLLDEVERFAREGDVQQCRGLIHGLNSYWESIKCELVEPESFAT